MKPHPPHMSTMSNAMMPGYHLVSVFDSWSGSIGEELCMTEPDNFNYPFTVAVMRSGITVGHIPISSVCSLFVQCSGTITSYHIIHLPSVKSLWFNFSCASEFTKVLAYAVYLSYQRGRQDLRKCGICISDVNVRPSLAGKPYGTMYAGVGGVPAFLVLCLNNGWSACIQIPYPLQNGAVERHCSTLTELGPSPTSFSFRSPVENIVVRNFQFPIW